MIDGRKYTIHAVTAQTLKNGNSHVSESEFVLDSDCRHIDGNAFYPNNAITRIAKLLWTECYECGPWIPSAVNQVTLHRDNDTITYMRAEKNGYGTKR